VGDGVGEGVGEDEVVLYQRTAETWRRRLLFQCLAEQNPTLQEWDGDEACQWPIGDETDLRWAYNIVHDANHGLMYPKTMIRGEPMIPLPHLPSSKSADLSGCISLESLRPVIKLLLLAGISWSSESLKADTVDPLQLEPAAQAMINTFAAVTERSSFDGAWVTWTEFYNAAATHMVRHILRSQSTLCADIHS
jgi:hypothetical protein